MTNRNLQKKVIENIVALSDQDLHIVIVHGGGPFIKESLDKAGIKSEFVAGQRVTSKEAMTHVEMALKGKVNGQLVSLINSIGKKAIGISGKDGKMVLGDKRIYEEERKGRTVKVDMGQVADVETVDTNLLITLLQSDYIPVIACIATNESGEDFNVNADMMSGHIAGALQAEDYIVLTDVDGLFRDIHDPESIISEMKVDEIEDLKNLGIIKGGMQPKLESCEVALGMGAKSARIINGTKPELIRELKKNPKIGTHISN